MTKIAKFLNQKKKKSCDISKDALSLQIMKLFARLKGLCYIRIAWLGILKTDFIHLF